MGGYLTGRCVLVTGAGGSIGAELCRQIARVGPSRIVLVDHAEDNLFEIERELVEDRHQHNAVAVLADCKEEDRMHEVMREHRPTVVFHAAAYKHVGPHGGQPGRGGPQQRDRHAGDGARGRRGRDQGLRADLDRQGGGAGDGHGRVEGAGRVGGGGRGRPPSRHGVHGRALRQRARLVGLGGADLPPPDRRRRAGDGHRPGDDALLHDDPGGGPARDPRGLAGGRAARSSCWRWASRSRSWSWRRT